MQKDQEFFNPFPGDSYDTAENTPRSLFDRLLFGCRISFYLRNFYVFCRSGHLARTTEFGQVPQTRNSYDNIRITESCGGKFHLRGLDNIDRIPGPVVFIGNHMSLLETAVMHAFMRPRKDFCFVIKRSLLKVPFFGNIMRKLGCIAVDRVNPRDDFKTVMEEGKKRLKSGVSVIIFPQSTRSAVFDETQFNTIGVKLAKHAGVPVIPFALRTDFLANGSLIKDLGPIKRERPIWFEFGEPILSVKGSGKEEQAQIVEFIKSRLTRWGCEIREPGRDPAKEEAAGAAPENSGIHSEKT